MPESKAAVKAYTLRIPLDFYDAVENIAETELRTVNAQILIFVRESIGRWHSEHHTEDADVTS